MAKLVLSMDGLVLKEFYLNKQRITIGRRSSNDIQINNLAVSGEHAAIVTILNDSFLEDLQSTNGTQVNGRAIKKCVLHHNDEIGLGKYKIRYLVEATPAERRSREGMIEIKGAIASDIGTTTDFGTYSNPTASADTPVDPQENQLTAINTPVDPHLEHQLTSVIPIASNPASPDTDTSPPASALSITDNLPSAAAHATLCLLSGSNRGKELPLTKEYALLGKNGGSVAAVSRELQYYYLSYVEGDTRPLINGEPLGDTPHRLNDGDEIDIAGVRMVFLIKS
ncbi:MAG: FHA domain-containing protein [Betaproteobacteria bacterium]|nr:FHA domain-containing protein [Betaproteobacteria bacterium]